MHVIKIKQLRDFRTVQDTIGVPGSQGCELCKPAIASVLSSLYNDHVMKPQHHGSQDTNDR
jgi:nitrite reductase (NAD(P)H)